MPLPVFDALRWLPKVEEGERRMLEHVIARHCMLTESAACAVAAPPGGMAAFRDWRDERCAAIVANSAGDLAAMLSMASLTGAAALKCSARRIAVEALRSCAHERVSRWMAVSEAVEALFVLAQVKNF